MTKKVSRMALCLALVFVCLALQEIPTTAEGREKDFAESVQRNLPESVVSRLPTDSKELFARREKIEGKLEIVAECEEADGHILYFVNTDKERLRIYFSDEPKQELSTGMRISFDGVKVGDEVAVDDTSLRLDESSAPAAAQSNFGEQRVLVLLVNFQNDLRTPFTVAQANSLLFDTANAQSVTNFYREASYQQTWLTGDTYGWFTLPINTGDCNGTSTASAAKQAAANAGINIAGYKKIIYVYPNMSGCSYSGIAGIGGGEAWINGSLYLRTLAHELGHNFGVYHSRSMDCGAAVVGGSCTTSEYGHIADIMGYPSITGHFNAYQKERLGWMNSATSPPITTVQSSGDYFITPDSAFDFSPKAIKVQRSSGEFYYIEVRRSIGFDAMVSSSLMNGVVIGLNRTGDGRDNYQLDMTPETSYWTDSSLPVGRSYTDSAAGITITPLSVSNAGAWVNINFGGQPACTMTNPTISATPTNMQWVTAGGSVSYSVTVTNNNSNGCPANTFNLQKALPAGWTATGASSFDLVSGATATASVQVAAPASSAAGSYVVGLGATNSADSNYSAAVSGNISVFSSLAVSVSSGDSAYSLNETAYLTAAVAVNGSAMAGASATFTIKRPNGAIAANGTVVTNSSGVALYTYKFNRKKDPTGTYQVSVSASLNGVSGSSTTSFVLSK